MTTTNNQFIAAKCDQAGEIVRLCGEAANPVPRPAYMIHNPCAICGWSKGTAIHSIVTDGPRKGQPWDHAYVAKKYTTAQPVPPVTDAKDSEQGEPVAYLRFWAAQRISPDGGVEADEGFEVCRKNDIGVDGFSAFPVYTSPQSVQPTDSTPKLHVGNSSFEEWYQTYPRQGISKQIARDAYAAGMGDLLVTYAKPVPPAVTQKRPIYCGTGHCSCIECLFDTPIDAS